MINYYNFRCLQKININVCVDTYDVQSVSGRAIPGGLELDCTFAEGSRAQSCILAVCRLENGMEVYCYSMNLTNVRENLQQSGQLAGLQPGLYTVKNVTEVESDGSVTLHRRTDVLQLTITEPPTTVTALTRTISGIYVDYSLMILCTLYMCYYESLMYRFPLSWWSIKFFCWCYSWRYIIYFELMKKLSMSILNSLSAYIVIITIYNRSSYWWCYR